jgi:hypothetical protein
MSTNPPEENASKPSYEEINYTLRPAKCVERKMMCEAFRRLSKFAAVETYRYVGFGSVYFADFSLVHRQLGISDMISIEKDVEKENRFVFNQPFRCITLEFGHSSEVLPKLDWDIRSIVWLDYDCPLSRDVLDDIRMVSSKAQMGSVLAVTVDVDPKRMKDAPRLATLKEWVGEDRVPLDVTERDLAAWGLAKVCRRIALGEVKEAIQSRNGGRSRQSQIAFKQLFNFHYADSAKMLTVGGLLIDRGQEETFDACGFKNLKCYRPDEEPLLIEVPKLTFHEMTDLDRQLPVEGDGVPHASGIPADDAAKYARIYRYFPRFAETEM